MNDTKRLERLMAALRARKNVLEESASRHDEKSVQLADAGKTANAEYEKGYSLGLQTAADVLDTFITGSY